MCVSQEILHEKSAIKELEDQYKSLERLRDMEGQVDLLRQEMLWAVVNKIEMVSVELTSECVPLCVCVVPQLQVSLLLQEMQEQRMLVEKEREKIPSKEQRLRAVEVGIRVSACTV